MAECANPTERVIYIFRLHEMESGTPQAATLLHVLGLMKAHIDWGRATAGKKSVNQWVSKKGKKTISHFDTFGIGFQFDKVVFCVRDIRLNTIQNIISSNLKRCRSTL